jgi:hypothetical protein
LSLFDRLLDSLGLKSYPAMPAIRGGFPLTLFTDKKAATKA